MKVAVIGLGSMGKRRIRLLKQYDSDIEIIGVDLNEDNCNTVKKDWGISTYTNLSLAVANEDIECAFISTSPLSHASIIEECLKNKLHVFTELNLVDNGYEQNIKLAKENNKVLFLSSTFLYRPEIKHIKNEVDKTNKPVNYNYHVGQYLPDWHPWESYKDFFVGDKRTNGCREIFAIELPWITDTFGPIKNFTVLGDKLTDLDIDYKDNYLVLVEHENGNKGVLCVDVVSRKAVRNLEVYNEEVYIQWDGSPTGLNEYDYEAKVNKNINLYSKIDQLDNYSSFVVENAYYDEIVDFINAVNGASVPRYSFEKDTVILKIIDRIENYENN